MTSPLLRNKNFEAQSVFTVENMLREAHRQKAIPDGSIPSICILDPDGDLAEHLIASGRATVHPHWACYHTKLYAFSYEGTEYGIVPYAVGASFAVLVAEELFASGCQLLISVTSAGQIISVDQPPYFILIERALRDEGTSHHYLPPSAYSELDGQLAVSFKAALANTTPTIRFGSTWTTDAPFGKHRKPSPTPNRKAYWALKWKPARYMPLLRLRTKRLFALLISRTRWGKSKGTLKRA